MKTAYATIKGFELTRMIRRGHCTLPRLGAAGEIRLVNELFGLAAGRDIADRFVMPFRSYCNKAVRPKA